MAAIAEGGVRETMQNAINGTVLDEWDPRLFGAALLEYLDDPQKAKAVGAAAREDVAQRWSLAQASAQLER